MPTLNIELTRDEAQALREELKNKLASYGYHLRKHREGPHYRPGTGAKKQKPFYTHRMAALIKISASLEGEEYEAHINALESRHALSSLDRLAKWEESAARYDARAGRPHRPWSGEEKNRALTGLNYVCFRP